MSAHDSDAYRANAKDCAEIALRISDPNTRLLFLTLAEAWLRLANYVDDRGLNDVTRPLQRPQQRTLPERDNPKK